MAREQAEILKSPLSRVSIQQLYLGADFSEFPADHVIRVRKNYGVPFLFDPVSKRGVPLFLDDLGNLRSVI